MKKLGTAQVGAPLKFQNPSFLNMQRTLLLKFFSFSVPKNTLKDTHRLENHLFLIWKQKKTFLKVEFFSTTFVRKESHSSERGALSSPKAFSSRKHLDESVAQCRKRPWVIPTIIEETIVRSTGPKLNEFTFWTSKMV